MLIKFRSLASLFLFKLKSLFRKRESGNAIDMLGSVFVVVMMFAMILALVSYASLVEKKLSIDNTVKQYLYVTEQYGYLDGLPTNTNPITCAMSGTSLNTAGLAIGSDAEKMIKDLERNGCTNVVIESDTTRTQKGYGQEVVVDLTVSFPNPLFETIGATTEEQANRSWFKILMPASSRTVSYNVRFESASRW